MRFVMAKRVPGIVAIAAMAIGMAHAEPSSPKKAVLVPELAEALWHADADGTQRILTDQPAQVDARDDRGWTPLMYAAFYADEACVRLILGMVRRSMPGTMLVRRRYTMPPPISGRRGCCSRRGPR